MIDFDAETLSRYLEAIERRNQIKEFWEEEGKPLLTEGSAGQDREHPLIKMLREHDLLVQKLYVDVKKAHSGPQPSAVIKPSPAARLRKVE